MITPTLKTDRFIIRAFKKCDLEYFSKYRSLPEVAKYQSWTDFSYTDSLALFEKIDYSKFAILGQWYQLAICIRESNILVGDLAVHFVDKSQVEIGFTTAPKYQKQNVASEAVSALTTYLFEKLNIHRITAKTDARNIASYRLLEKLGFRREAHFHQNIFFKGSWSDEYLYALLHSEYNNL
ncbi:GNAT family N-acetyltransferase [Microbulbifer epialgicus]|uniref:GNAT family N-acetyltransferase n=1 Tax=Microbulbifer epialgicus TaxID=393907 RepID=A0ABV4P095_9GAMM